MALPTGLHSVDLTYRCPHCSHPLVMPGSWFKSAWRFNCRSCKTTVPLTYSIKLALFGRHQQVQRPEVVDPDEQSVDLGGSTSRSSRGDPAATQRIIFGDKRFQNDPA